MNTLRGMRQVPITEPLPHVTSQKVKVTYIHGFFKPMTLFPCDKDT